MYYVTTPIYYVNSEPHIGTAYTTILADSAARYHRMLGEKSFFLTGTDEHGDKIAQTALRHNVLPKQFVDGISSKFQMLWPKLRVVPDRFIRTTDEEHIRVVQSILQKLFDKGDIYFGEYGGLYCTECERFYTEKELVDGKCPDHKIVPQYVSEKNYFFKMSQYQQWWLDYIAKRPEVIMPERYRNEVLGFLREPLEDLCITRPKERLTWGIEVPFDKNFVTYVWFDALLNYLSGIHYSETSEEWKHYWKDSQHLIGKDILKPHGIYWPIMLHAAGIDVFQRLTVHGYWNFKDAKISKSSGKPLPIEPLVAAFGADAVRFFLLRDMVVGLDAGFSLDSLVKRINSDLANDFGNLLSRISKLVADYFDGVIPESGSKGGELRAIAAQLTAQSPEWIREYRFHQLIEETMQLVRATNRHFESSAPWSLVKTDKSSAGTVLYDCAEALRIAAVLLHPVMPERTATLLARMGEPVENFDFDNSLAWGRLRSGAKLLSGDSLFPRIDEKTLPSLFPEFFDGKPAADTANTSETNLLLDIEDFKKVDLRTAKIISAEKVPKADKLLKLQIDVGGTPRQIIAGIAEFYRPEDIIGKSIIVVANLKPATLRGEKSEGMLLAAKSNGKLSLITVEDEQTPSGSSVG